MIAFNSDDQLKLEEPLVRVTYESMRKIFKQAQKHIERDTQAIDKQLGGSLTSARAGTTSKEETLTQLTQMEQRLHSLKRKITSLGEEQETHVEKLRARVDFLNGLTAINSLDSSKFENYCRTRLDILLVDYLLRQGNLESAKVHAKCRKIEPLVDIDVLLQCTTIENSLRDHNTQECLTWCQDNKSQLKRMGNNLEFQVRLQYYIELVRHGKKYEAIQYYRKYLVKNYATHWQDILHAPSLIAFEPDTQVPEFKRLYQDSRWDFLVKEFVSTFYSLHGLPMHSQLNECLATGISALKTHSCRLDSNEDDGDSNALPDKIPRDLSRAYMCPVCSKELKPLAKDLPYSHRVKSHLDPDCVVLPNYRIYGLEKLKYFTKKEGLDDTQVMDPVTLDIFESSAVKTVYPS